MNTLPIEVLFEVVFFSFFSKNLLK